MARSKKDAENDLDNDIQAENQAAVEEQIAAKHEETEDPGQLTEDVQGDFQRRTQIGVKNPKYEGDDENTVEIVGAAPRNPTRGDDGTGDDEPDKGRFNRDTDDKFNKAQGVDAGDREKG